MRALPAPVMFFEAGDCGIAHKWSVHSLTLLLLLLLLLFIVPAFENIITEACELQRMQQVSSSDVIEFVKESQISPLQEVE